MEEIQLRCLFLPGKPEGFVFFSGGKDRGENSGAGRRGRDLGKSQALSGKGLVRKTSTGDVKRAIKNVCCVSLSCLQCII